LWPNYRETFGKPEMEADEEFEIFKNLYMRTLELKKVEKPKEPELPEEEEEGGEKEKEKENDEGIEDDMGEEGNVAGSEDEDEERYGVDFPDRPETPLISEDPLLDDPVTSGGDASVYGASTPPAGGGK
jgi:hypothetical protein